MVNFFGWLEKQKQIRDPFFMEDDEWQRLYDEFITKYT